MRMDLAADMPGVPFERAILLAGRSDKRVADLAEAGRRGADAAHRHDTVVCQSGGRAVRRHPPAAEVLVVRVEGLTGCGGGISGARLHRPAALGCRVRLPWGGRFGWGADTGTMSRQRRH